LEKGGIFLIKVTYNDLGSLYFSVVSDFQVEDVYEYIKKNERIKEAMVLWTCNRFEIYFSPGDRETVQYLEDFVREKAKRYSVIHGWDSIKHLFLVSAGLDSMVVGENEILGQVREAWEMSRENSLSGQNLNQVLRKALQIGKKVRRENIMLLQSRSVASEALKHIHFNDGASTLVVGAGKLGTQISTILSRRRIRFAICNRTSEKAKEIALRFNASYEDFDVTKWKNYDNVILAIRSPKFIMTREDIANSRIKNIIDFGTPANVPADLGDGVKIINMEKLAGIIESREMKKNEFSTNGLKIVNEEFIKFSRLLMSTDKEEMLRKIYSYSDQIVRDEIKYIEKRAKSVDDVELMGKGLQSVRNRLLGFVINGIKRSEDIRSSETVTNMEEILNENLSRYETKKIKKIA